MLEIKNLHVNVDNKEIIKGINLIINPGEVHAIMGPNGSGKSTLAQVLAGREEFEVTKGEINYLGNHLLELPANERAVQGIFLGMQYPVEIPGVSNIYFLKAALNAIRKANDLPEVDAMDFINLIKSKMQQMDMKQELLYRSVNEGFSGGEKKRNEILQMLLLEPKLAILDETDSGLDIDALKVVAKGINSIRANDRAILLVTHYQRLLNYIEPDFIHVLVDGKIIKSGDKKLAYELEAHGYSWIEEQVL